MKITIEQDGKDKQEIETAEFFLYTDKGASWKGIESNILMMVGFYMDMIKEKYRKKIFANKE